MAEQFGAIKILGSRIYMIQNLEVLEKIEHWIEGDSQQFYFIVNTGFHGLWAAHNHTEFKRIVNSADLFSPDGIAPLWVACIKGISLKKRATSAELMKLFFARANKKGYRSFFYGDTDETPRSSETKAGV